MNRSERITKLTESQQEISNPPNVWLSQGECEHFKSICSQSYAMQWLVGRWIAKQQLAKLLELSDGELCKLHVQTRDGQGRGCRPLVFFDGQLQDWRLTISHSQDWVYAAASLSATDSLGADIADTSTLRASFVNTWFSSMERQWCHEVGGLAANIMWSMKEAIYKATNRGERFMPKKVDLAEAGLLQDGLKDTSQGNRAFELANESLFVKVQPLPGAFATLACETL